MTTLVTYLMLYQWFMYVGMCVLMRCMYSMCYVRRLIVECLIDICAYLCVYVCVCGCVYLYMCVCVCVCVCV